MSRGFSAREPGDRFISDSSNTHWLDFVDYELYPNKREVFEDTAELHKVMHRVERDNGSTIEWENTQNGLKAVYLIKFVDENNKCRLKGKFIRKNPQCVPNGIWTKLNGYSLVGNVDQAEFYPIKPDDLLNDCAHSREDLVRCLKASILKRVKGSNFKNLGDILLEMIDQAITGNFKPIPGADQYRAVLEKTAGEYLGVIALMHGNIRGDITEVHNKYNVDTFENLNAVFPQDKTYPLIDSILLDDDVTVSVSSKAHKGNGSASSLSGLIKYLTPALEKKYRKEALVLKTLATESILEGPILAAGKCGIVSKKFVDDALRVVQGEPLTNELMNFINEVDVDKSNNKYQEKFHLLLAIVNRLVEKCNTDKMSELGVALLSDTGYIQVLTQGHKTPKGFYQTYYVKDPEKFTGSFVLKNKSYWAANAIARLGFKLTTENK